VNTPMLEDELTPLNAQIEQVRKKQKVLEEDLRAVEAELETFSVDRKRFDALRDVCNALDKLDKLEANELFWEGIAEAQKASGYVELARSRISHFEEGISSILENQQSFQKQIDQCLDELSVLYEEVSEAHEREEQRKEAYIINREISSVPYRAMIMPWTRDAESERHFRRAVFLALLMSFVFAGLMSLIKVPIPDRSTTVVEIPERLVQLVKNEALTRMPARKKVPKQMPEEAKDESKVAKKETKPQEKQSDTSPSATDQVKAADSGGGGNRAAARKKAETVGIMAFKDSFKDLMKETLVAKVGTEARLTKESLQVAGRAVAQRSLVSVQAQNNSSRGIGNAGVSRNIGNSNVDRLGGIGIGIGSGGTGVGIARVSSNIANLEESSRPTSDGLPPGRTDEEIQIVFDRYKATLYRIYNKELRKDPTLRGKILMRISIEASGAVSMCDVESTDLGSPELVASIVERIKRFNFGPKEGVQKVTILYPIDFLPG
jgi:peptidoglycan hydrolase CwlO-like protein